MLRVISLLAVAALLAQGGILSRGPARMICHRTANSEMPENTLESLDLAARLGCSVVEIDLRITLDGELVLNHDGFLERLTNGMGEADKSYFDELQFLDAGSWMGSRFRGLHIPRFVDALHVAEKYGIGLSLDFKDKQMGPAVLAALKHEGMLEKVWFGGEWEDVKQAYAHANEDPVANVEPPVTNERVEELHRQGKVVIANFSANGHEMDLAGMQAAVAAGVDWINVDYPRLGADAIGQPVETKIAELVAKADSGPSPERAKAILALARYPGFPLEARFRRWLADEDDHISRAAALSLLTLRPAVPDSIFVETFTSPQSNARKNSAWALGLRGAPITGSLLRLLRDKDPRVVQEVLLALSRCPGNVPAIRIEPFLEHQDALVRATAALALARHQPKIAAVAIPQALMHEESMAAKEYAPYVDKRVPHLSPSEIAATVARYRALMKMTESGAMLSGEDARKFFEREAFRSVRDYSSTVGPLAGFQLWDRVARDSSATIRALSLPDTTIADRAEWILIQAGPSVLPAVRPLLRSTNPPVRDRAVRIVAWQHDAEALPILRAMREDGETTSPPIDWAIGKIEMLSLALR